MGSALPRRTCHSVFCVGARILGIGLFSVAPLLPKIQRLCIFCFISDCSGHTVGMYDSELIYMMVVGLPWDIQNPQWERQWLLPALFWCRRHWSNKNRQQFPGVVHEEDLQWGSKSLLHQRKGEVYKEKHSKENQPAQDLWGYSWCTRHPWRLPAMAFMTLPTSGPHWEAARRAAKTPPSTGAAGHCRVLGGWQGFTKKALVSLALKLIFARNNKLHGKGSQETCCVRDLCNVCSARLQLVVRDSCPASNTQGFSRGLMWQSSSSFRRCTSIFPGIIPQKAKGKAGPDMGRDVSGSNRKSFHTAGDTLALATRCHLQITREHAACKRDVCCAETKTWIRASELWTHCELKNGCSEPVSFCPPPSPQRLLQNSLHCFPHENNLQKQRQLSTQAHSL